MSESGLREGWIVGCPRLQRWMTLLLVVLI
jgi:hypothetical protein